ncbi:hypothetical protein IGS68_32410 (plasmid) [Skermanella sp. TT6]|uniref:Uncharacterized protein n=1 Tax=Skermanella cutis TaxID=2775420 RepID=A0ABX7BH46_9PROT|nr:hypothetical protein [Skermanella sp. TT6]QQP93717.1 hypothetical protein IGS68_32410 [Skermanella sp. TT6]
MQSVNIDRRETIESYYPLDSFIHDAGLNARAKAMVMHGLRILSSPDAAGDFKLTKAQHNVAEDAHDQDAVFVYSVRDDDNAWFDKAEPDAAKAVHAKDNPTNVEGLYRDFIDRVIQAARDAHFQPAIGRGEKRLEGFHGG